MMKIIDNKFLKQDDFKNEQKFSLIKLKCREFYQNLENI